jgi:hypothetical protein
MTRMFLKSEVMSDIERLKTSISEKSNSASRDLATLAEGIIASLTSWEDRLHSIIQRRDELDAEEAEVNQELIKLMTQINHEIVGISSCMGDSIELEKPKLVKFDKTA